jgi:hypothetical protein
MTTRSRSVTVTDEPTRLDLAAAGASVLGQGFSGRLLPDANSIYVGGSDVTEANGVPVYAGEWLPGLGITHTEEVWAVCATGETAEVRVMETGT